MQLGLYVHPFAFGDLDRLGGPRSLVGLGFGEIAIAAAYHAGRWLVPSRSDGIVRVLEDGIVHSSLTREYGPIKARSSRLVVGTSPLADTCAQGKRLGLATSAWTVLFHNTRLGSMHLGSCVENAFGEHYEYALCPARPEVREYGTTLLADLATTPDLDTIELEAAGWMGHKHGGHHDKSSFGSDGYADFLLSYCFCSVCKHVLGELGVDADQTRSRARELLRGVFHDGDAMGDVSRPRERLAQDLGKAVVAAMLEARRRGNESFLQAARAALPRKLRLALQVQPDAFFTGSQMGIELARAGPLVDELVITCYGEGQEQISALLGSLGAPGGTAIRLALWPRAPHFRSDADLTRVRRIALERGLAGLRIYHAGLLPERTLRRAAAALRDPPV